MSEETKEISLEIQAARLTGALETQKFLDNHLLDSDGGYARTPENNQKITDYIAGKNWEWTAKSCEVAYIELKAAGELTKATIPPAEVFPTTETPEPQPESLYPWGNQLTAESLRAIINNGDQFVKFLKSREWGKEFDRQVLALNLPKSFLRSSL